MPVCRWSFRAYASCKLSIFIALTPMGRSTSLQAQRAHAHMERYQRDEDSTSHGNAQPEVKKGSVGGASRCWDGLQVVGILTHYLELRQQLGIESEHLFLSSRGGPMIRFGIGRRVALHARTAVATCPSLQGWDITPHCFRHTTAFHLIEAGTISSWSKTGSAMYTSRPAASTWKSVWNESAKHGKRSRLPMAAGRQRLPNGNSSRR